MASETIPGFPRYTVNSDGFVCGPKGRLTPAHRCGYATITLCGGGVKKSAFVHVLVAEMFIGPKPGPEYEVRHLNGCRTDNRLENLAWGTKLENARDRDSHGTTAVGERHGRSKLTSEAVSLARQAWAESPRNIRALAARFGVSSSAMHSVIRGVTWR